MRHDADPLYLIFEQHLFNALVEEEATEAFLVRVVDDYIERLKCTGTVIPVQFEESLKTDLKEEVLEMLRKKTYGHYDLNAYRKAKGINVATAEQMKSGGPQRSEDSRGEAEGRTAQTRARRTGRAS